jgi:hypothetical protein
MGKKKDDIHIIHPLKTHSLGLRDKEPDEEEHREAASTEEKVGSVTSFPHMTIPKPVTPSVLFTEYYVHHNMRASHMRHGLCNNEIKKPLRSGCESNVHSPKPCSWDLGHNNPAARTPSKLKECGKKEDAGEGKVTDGRDGVARYRRVKSHVEADHEHCAPLRDRGPKKRFSWDS